MPACYLKCGPGTSSISITWELVTLRPPPQTYWTRTCIFIICLVIPVHIRVWKILLLGRRRQWHPTPVLLPGKSHGQRSLVGCSPWGRWGLDMTEWLHFHFSLSCIGEGNGNPLQCSCLVFNDWVIMASYYLFYKMPLILATENVKTDFLSLTLYL